MRPIEEKLHRDPETFVSVLARPVLLISFCRIVAFMYLTKAALYGLWTRNSEWRERGSYLDRLRIGKMAAWAV